MVMEKNFINEEMMIIFPLSNLSRHLIALSSLSPSCHHYHYSLYENPICVMYNFYKNFKNFSKNFLKFISFKIEFQ